ncbi:MAG TPA: hypothetical protein VJ485_00875 [archaeon]|nr:hypothetical protein [archaeon]
MAEVVIRYKGGRDWERNREIIRISADYNYQGVGSGGDFCIMVGEEGLEEFCKKLRKLGYVESVKLK